MMRKLKFWWPRPTCHLWIGFGRMVTTMRACEAGGRPPIPRPWWRRIHWEQS